MPAKETKPPPIKEEMTPFQRMRELVRRVVNVPKEEAVKPKARATKRKH